MDDQETKVPKSIVLSYDGKDYELEFDRASAEKAERMYGFRINELMGSVQITTIKNMFTAAFAKNHPKVPQSLINEIYNRTSDKVDLYQALVSMYLETAQSVLDDPEVDEGKAASWKVV
ncbi:MAG: DUF5055 domain-containing protein [Olsenella sp.]|nr:DUF5055 domain-containing protein [Olsenella sp.]MBR1828749.1 DUF5055 domain-containing protein [Atopobiaceae bacterium]